MLALHAAPLIGQLEQMALAHVGATDGLALPVELPLVFLFGMSIDHALELLVGRHSGGGAGGGTSAVRSRAHRIQRQRLTGPCSCSTRRVRQVAPHSVGAERNSGSWSARASSPSIGT